jgi:uncharacterized protein (TIGR02145 family)
MKQKLFFLMLTLFMLSVASVQAQVTIGADEPPHSSAVLDLQSDNLGLKLPTIELGDVSVFQLSGTTTNAEGIMIYNKSDETTGGSGKGIYVWEGKWVYAGKSAPVEVPVTKIDITSAGFVTELNASGAGNTLKLTATVEPDNASNKTLSWMQVYNPATTVGSVTIDATGLVTGVKAGTVTVRATATDGSGVYRNLELTVVPTDLVTGITVVPVNGSSPIAVSKTLQMQATVEPITANPTVLWSVDDGTLASVSTSGLVSASADGSTNITATAADGSGTIGTYPLVITPGTPLNTFTVEIGETDYQAYVYLGKTWTVENMRHGVAQYSYYDNDELRPNNYYTYTQAQAICTGDFRLPTADDYRDLSVYLENGNLPFEQRAPWFGAAAMIGGHNVSAWANWGVRTEYWTSDSHYVYFVVASGHMTVATNTPQPAMAWSVRCVMD